MPPALVRFFASPAGLWIAGILSTVAGLGWLVTILQPSHPLAASDLMAAIGFASIALHALNGSPSKAVSLEKVSNQPNAVATVQAAVDQKAVTSP